MSVRVCAGGRAGKMEAAAQDSSLRLLVVDDEDVIRQLVRQCFHHRGFEVLEAGSVAEAREVVSGSRPDVALVDYSLPDGTGLDLLPWLKQGEAGLPTVLLTGHGSIELAVRAMKAGADQFLTKPLDLGSLAVVVDRLIEQTRLRKVAALVRARGSRRPVDPFAGTSAAIRQLAERARRVAAAHAPVLILGETGSGKGVTGCTRTACVPATPSSR